MDEKISKIRKTIGRVDQFIAGIALATIVILVTINVFCRYVLGIVFNWMEEFATISFVWCTFVGIASAFNSGDHVGINVIVMLLPKPLQRIIMILVNVLVLVINVTVFVLSLEFCRTSWVKTSPTIGIPYTFINAALTVGFALLIVYTILNIIELCRCKAEDVVI